MAVNLDQAKAVSLYYEVIKVSFISINAINSLSLSTLLLLSSTSRSLSLLSISLLLL